MFSRSLVSASRRAAVTVATRPSIAARSAAPAFARRFKSDYVPVTQYSDSGDAVRTTAELPVKGTDPADVVNQQNVEEPTVTRPVAEDQVKRLPNVLQKFSLHGKIVAVTGGARGLGFNMAQALCEAGASGIAILDVLKQHGDAAAAELYEKCGTPAHFYQVDVRNAEAVHEVIANVVSEFGRIDVLINSAGIADSNIKAEDYDTEMFRRLLDINITGTFLTAQAAGRAMIHAKSGGSIINIASMSGHVVNYPQQQSAYNASKAAVIQLTKSLAAEWAQHNIRVNAICPGYMDTALNRVPQLDNQKTIWKSMTPQNRLGDVDELNGLALLLASDASTFMTGADILIDGGYSVL
jgi:NAD(P)-dependent dehydrogenase (short-subunit alcohol dehydrogenase family)